MTEEYLNKLMSKYRNEKFEYDGNDIRELVEDAKEDGDEDLVTVFNMNMHELTKLINENPMDKERVRKLFLVTLNIYRIARKREISLHGFNILAVVSSSFGYPTDKVYSILNTGEYHRPHRPR